MKRTIVIAALLASAVTAGAFTTTSPVVIDAVRQAWHPVLSPDGSTILFSTDNHTGLKALDITTGSVTVLDEGASAGFAPVFSTDGGTVIYRTLHKVDGLHCRDVRSTSTDGKVRKTLAAPVRGSIDLNSLAGNSSYAVSEIGAIKVAVGGKTATVRPLSDAHSYLWASLSADGGKILFNEPFSGVWTANADGSHPVRVADSGDFPCWAGDNLIVYVVSKNDGYQTLYAHLMAMDTETGETRQISDDSIIVSEATACAGGRIVYSDTEGNLYTLFIKK